MAEPAISVRVQAEPFDVAAELALVEGRNVGAIASFVGLCRDEDGRLEALELEHYPGMAEAQIEAIAAEAGDRWPLAALTVIHRHGRIPVGGQIVLVVAASRHRDAAFEGARFVMDYLKTDAPFWKKEHPRGGGEGEWVAANEADDNVRERWKRSWRG